MTPLEMTIKYGPNYWGFRDAIESDCIKSVEFMCEWPGLYDIEKADIGDTPWTPLIWAARRGTLPIVKVLVRHGAKVNATDNLKMTALMHAAIKGHFDIVKYLVNKGADIFQREENDNTALELVCFELVCVGRQQGTHCVMHRGALSKIRRYLRNLTFERSRPYNVSRLRRLSEIASNVDIPETDNVSSAVLKHVVFDLNSDLFKELDAYLNILTC